ncbi:COG4648 family protein [Kangiella sediminilitoris]|uniref:Membrane protein n=1 Tax=Kangiella sediminilitoris TaxID=1144748 RepID=A0A1B3BE18_9GAMM|nr:hypothetical protein [Kangiella sediminilitoris]AOE50975.1 membrane protein [Kangiella sediminilitoris]
MAILLKIAIAVVVLLYPIAIYFGLQYIEPKYLALTLAGLVILRALLSKSQLLSSVKGLWFIILMAGLTVAALSFLQNSTLGLKLYPVIITTSFLVVFGYSLYKPPTVIERLARLQEPDLPPEGVAYTRTVTKVWCGFFILNLAISIYTVFYSSMAVWTLYNGLISYVLMGILFLAELIVRKFIIKKV